MFKRNDFLVAQDRLYKEGVPFRKVYAKYGRIFKCPITYFRVVDRLGIGRGPKIEIVRGGLRHKYLVLRLQSTYGYPISVNVYVGCENKMKLKTIKKTSVDPTTIKAITADATTDLEEKLGPGSDASDTNLTTVPTTIQ
ncbi:unnamed protein product [Pieris brassicae]|uniref:Uncharacterized protein n=1 Tax=Pieris brassicae TaxID=7116 RepID=A0A9P0SYW8_PIEBR|nr:unnamed protein product [Pieris brassicae]